MKNNSQLPDAAVSDYIRNMSHPLKNVVDRLREIILSASTEIAEQIKWNSPSYYYTGQIASFDPREYKRDIVVFNLHKKEYVLLVFPTGSAVDANPGEILECKFKDSRKTAKFSSLAEVESKKQHLIEVLQRWINATEK